MPTKKRNRKPKYPKLDSAVRPIEYEPLSLGSRMWRGVVATLLAAGLGLGAIKLFGGRGGK